MDIRHAEHSSKVGRLRRVFDYVDKTKSAAKLINDESLVFNTTVFEPARNQIRNSPYHAQLRALPGAVAGVNMLAELSESIEFSTVRPDTKVMQGHTETSLRRINLLSEVGEKTEKDRAVVIVKDPTTKMERGLQKLHNDTESRLVIVDDGVDGLLTAAIDLQKDPRYAELFTNHRVTLVAFGWTKEELSQENAKKLAQTNTYLEVIPMNTWAEVGTVAQALSRTAK